MLLQKPFAKKAMHSNPQPQAAPPVDFYSLSGQLPNGRLFAFEPLRGQYVLLVNTASGCGYTGQYAALQQLQQQYAGRLQVLGFPCNDFGGQEPGTDAEIAEFCQLNYGVSFPLMQKAPVTGPQQQPIYQWLTQPVQNGWNSKAPSWNFCKYLVSDTGVLLGVFGPGTAPDDDAITHYLKKSGATAVHG